MSYLADLAHKTQDRLVQRTKERDEVLGVLLEAFNQLTQMEMRSAMRGVEEDRSVSAKVHETLKHYGVPV